MEISFCSDTNSDEIIATRFCIWRSSCVVVEFKKKFVSIWGHELNYNNMEGIWIDRYKEAKSPM